MKYSSAIFNILEQKYPGLLSDSTNFTQSYFEAIQKTRDKQAELEKVVYLAEGKPLPQLSGQHPFEVTEKYRIDYVYEEIRHIRLTIAVSISSAEYFLPLTCDFKHTNQQTYDDFMFWYNIDYGIRLLASAWDRLAHFLYLAFELKIKKLDFQSVIRAIQNKGPDIVSNENFKSLKQLNDTKLKEIEAKYSEGLRNVVDHIIGSFTQYFMLILEKYRPDKPESIEELITKRKAYLDFLDEHFDYFQKGLDSAIKLAKESTHECK